MGLLLQCFSRQNVRMICAKNCEKLSKSVKIMVNILSVHFSGHGVYVHNLIEEEAQQDSWR